MKSRALQCLFPAKGRRALLKLLFQDGCSGSASELARRAKVTPRTALLVLDELREVGLVDCRGVGAALVFQPLESDLADALRSLLDAAENHSERRDRSFEASAAYFGAPLLREAPRGLQPLETTLAIGAKKARQDPTLFRALPVLVLRNWRSVDWTRLRDCSLGADSKQEVGMLLDLTGVLADVPELSKRASAFADERRHRLEYFFDRRTEFDERLAGRRTPRVVRQWNFLMNMDLEMLRAAVKTHEPSAAS